MIGLDVWAGDGRLMMLGGGILLAGLVRHEVDHQV
jgi:hypothetical protein